MHMHVHMGSNAIIVANALLQQLLSLNTLHPCLHFAAIVCVALQHLTTPQHSTAHAVQHQGTGFEEGV